jgi:hypothetical protein
MHRLRAWAGFLAGGLLFVGVYFLLPFPRVQNVLYEIIGASGVAGILIAVRINRPARRAPWFLIATGAGLLVAGDVAWTVYAYTGHTPYPSFADVLYLSAYPFLAAGVLRLRRPPNRTLDRARLAETAVITTGAALMMWEPFFEPYAVDPSLPLVERLVSLAYPMADLLLIAVLIRLAVGVASRTPAYAILMPASCRPSWPICGTPSWPSRARTSPATRWMPDSWCSTSSSALPPSIPRCEPSPSRLPSRGPP